MKAEATGVISQGNLEGDDRRLSASFDAQDDKDRQVLGGNVSWLEPIKHGSLNVGDKVRVTVEVTPVK